MLSGDYKNNMLLILMFVGTFLITCSVFIFYFLPHYDEGGKYTLFGKYYNKEHIFKQKKMTKIDKNNQKLKKILNNYKTQNFSMSQKWLGLPALLWLFLIQYFFFSLLQKQYCAWKILQPDL